MSIPLSKWSVVTPPAITPVSLFEVKAHCRVETTADDPVLFNLIQACTDYAQDVLGQSLVTQTIAAIFNAEDVELSPPVRDYPWDPLSPLGTPLGTPSFATWGTYNRAPMIRLLRGPVQSIVSLVDGNGNAITAYTLERTPTGDRIRFIGTSLYPVVATYVAGYGLPPSGVMQASTAIPPAIRVAIMTHVATLYANRESATQYGAKVTPHSLEDFYRMKSRRIPGG